MWEARPRGDSQTKGNPETIAARRASLYVGNLLCLAIREDGRRGETERLLRSMNL